MSRLLSTTLLALLAGPLAQASAKPPDLPFDTTISCAVAQAPEMPIDGLLVESAVEEPKCPLCDIVMDVCFPPLRLRHIPLVMKCPCFKACCDSVHETMMHCCASMKHCQAPGQEESAQCPPCAHCPAVGRCRMVTEEAGEDEPAQEEAEPADEAQAEDEVLEVMPREETEQGDDASEEKPADPGPSPTQPHALTCPYLQKKSCPSQAAATDASLESLPATPLEGFDRLRKATHLYRKAEHCRTAGKVERACRLYERVKKLCPGSRIEHLACERLEQLYAQKALPETKPATEEAEPQPCQTPACNQDVFRTECGTVVDELRARAAKLLEEGDYVEGYALAEMAIKLSSDCEDALALLDRASMLLNKPKKATVYPEAATDEKAEESQSDASEAEDSKTAPEESKSDAGEAEDQAVMPPAEEPAEAPDCGCEKFVQPPLPPVDPKIVDTLEKVLREVGDPAIPKLVIEVDEPTAEEQEDPVSTWPYVPPQTDLPASLLVDPQDDDLTLEDDDEGMPAPEDQAWAYIGEHLEKMLQNTIDALQKHKWTAVDIDRPEGPNGPRGRVNIQVGAVQCTLVCDGWGHRLVVVRLTPEATGDLREVQQGHNDRVLHWIELLNSGGSGDDDEEAATTDDEEDDLLYYDEPFPL